MPNFVFEMSAAKPPSLSELFTYSSFAHAVSGSIASGVAMTLFYPLDQIRIVAQADESKESKSERQVAREMYEREGITTFYKGLSPLLVALAASNFIYYYLYSER